MADDEKDSKPAAKDEAPVIKKDAGDAIVPKAAIAAAAKPAAKKPPPPVDEDDEDDEYEDEEDDEDDEPPPKVVKKAPVAKATPKGKALPKGKVAARVARPVRRLGVGHYLPWAVGGMALVGSYVAWYPEHSYAVPAVLGIAICVWAYMGIGSVNEIKA